MVGSVGYNGIAEELEIRRPWASETQYLHLLCGSDGSEQRGSQEGQICHENNVPESVQKKRQP